MVCFRIYDLMAAGSGILITLFVPFLLQKRNRKVISGLKGRIISFEALHKDLRRSILQVQEEERSNLGRNLHDDTGSSLATLRLAIDVLSYDSLDRAAFELFKAASKKLVDKIASSVRTISHSLSPPNLEMFGLFAAVEDLANDINRTAALEVSAENNAEKILSALHHSTALSLFRVVEELLTNSIKHAQAKKVWISFTAQDDTLFIRYRDDGKGISPTRPRGMGLNNIEHRLLVLDAVHAITSSPGSGFSMMISLSVL